jgi:hypothetical protein
LADLNTTKLDITVIIAIAGYTAFRIAVHIDKGYLPKPAIFAHREYLLTAFAYAGIIFLLTALVTTLWVNPWWTLLFVLFFTAILGDFVIIAIFRRYTYIFSGITMVLSVYLFCRYIL